MELKDLRAFVAVAEEQSFTRAAQRLHLSQPPLTRQIRELEEELGVSLFIRSAHGAQLTEEGTQLLARARDVFSASDGFLELARDLATGERATVRIGIAWRLWELVNHVRACHLSRFPAVTIEGHDIFSGLQNKALQAKQIDVGFMRPPVDTSSLESEGIVQEHFVVLMSDGHPLAARPSVRLADIAALPLLVQDRAVSAGFHDKVLSLYQDAGVKPAVIHTAVGPAEEAGRIPIASGKAVHLVPAGPYTSTNFGSGIAVVKLDEPKATVDVLMAWRKGERAPCVLKFVATVREAFPSRTGAALR